MNTGARIEKRPALLSKHYYQNGERLDHADMVSKLEKEPGPADAAR